MTPPKIGILMGSKSDAEVMREAAKVLEEFEIPYEMRVLSAHRSPREASDYAQSAESRGIQALIAGAGFAAHLAGTLAAQCTLPVIGVPLDSSALKGLDSLLATVQMPKGIPVACMTIGKAGATNAALFAVQILSRSESALAQRLKEYREKMRQEIISIKL
ncbi:5-(carboxyamino)imidazole ribonucleotide mutase [Acidobacteria bacterium AH-259-G07]|nr:5-(carboxyamino)imidazole ribonucleotide mutase [Acidobacteria bacterium AH-259-G07]